MIYNIPREHFAELAIGSGKASASVMRCVVDVGQVVITRDPSFTDDNYRFRKQRILAINGIAEEGKPLPDVISDWQGTPAFSSKVITDFRVPAGILTLLALEWDESGLWVSNNSCWEVFNGLPNGATIYQFQYHAIWEYSRLRPGIGVAPMYWIPTTNKFKRY